MNKYRVIIIVKYILTGILLAGFIFLIYSFYLSYLFLIGVIYIAMIVAAMSTNNKWKKNIFYLFVFILVAPIIMLYSLVSILFNLIYFKRKK